MPNLAETAYPRQPKYALRILFVTARRHGSPLTIVGQRPAAALTRSPIDRDRLEPFSAKSCQIRCRLQPGVELLEDGRPI
jgi:hypothetical protein